jgi:UDP-N-acetylmuramate dehydrogenase
VRLFVVGNGSNLLVPDAGVDGLVVRLRGELERVDIDEGAGVAVAGGGAKLPLLALSTAKLGYRALLFMGGIPACVGGAVKMNAGDSSGDVAGALIWAEFIDGAGQISRLEAAGLGLGYRSCGYMEENPGSLLLRAAFGLGEREAATAATTEAAGTICAREELRALLKARKERQPSNPRNCGSVFRNPAEGATAGQLLDRAGLKGRGVGGAQISTKHANWIVNAGGASAADVAELIELARSEVERRFGIVLECEVECF